MISGLDSTGSGDNNLLPYGTAYVRVLFLINYQGAANNNVRWNSIVFGREMVTSVGLSMPAIFSAANSPITSTGTLTVTLATQTANTVWSGPASGGAAAPTFRSLVAADIPALSYISSTATQSANAVLAGPTTGAAAAPAFRSLVFADIPSTAAATNSTIVARDSSGGSNFSYVAANNQWAYLDSHFQSLESGAYQTVGGPFENMAKYSEDFTVATWDKNGGSCSATANSTAAPDGNTTADTITAVTATPIIQQHVAGLVDGGQYRIFSMNRGSKRYVPAQEEPRLSVFARC